MAKRSWTEEQASAIEIRDKTLLVSAAAGSGKTATLTERIIRTLCDTQNETFINELLVVTFTNAAAAEMRSRISASLKEACERNPESRHLTRQLMLFPSAKIRTIDSFCGDLLRANVDRVGIAPSFRILDGAEGQLLALSILEGMIASIYDGELAEVASPAEFEELADCLTSSKKMQNLSEVIYKVYEDISCEEDPFKTLEGYREALSPDSLDVPEKNRYIAFYIGRLRELCEYYVKYTSSLIKELSVGSPEERKYTDTLSADADIFKDLLRRDSYFELCEVLSGLKWAAVPRRTAGCELTELQISVRDARDGYKKALKALKDRAFSFDADSLRYCFTGLYSRVGTLVRVLVRFDALFMAEKRRRSAFSYNDIERFTYNALWENGKKTDIARSLEKQYKYVYIDEYQDVNALQDKIFEAVSREDNRFMVGDIKQSIYGFRGADSDIFAGMKKSFPRLGECADSKCAGIFMSENFRCDEGIIDFVNGIFDKIFGAVGDSIGYENADRLKYGKGAISDKSSGGVPFVRVVYDNTELEGHERSMAEPRAVAREIKRLIENERLDDGRQIKPSDISIVMRKGKARAQDYADAIREAGLPVHISGHKDFFLNREILLALCLLNAVDNPQRDIYLAGLLRSPLYDFSADELLRISECGEGALYTSLLKYCEENPDFEKGVRFIKTLTKYRKLSESASTASLIYRLYRETGLFALASKNGGKDNLTLLFNYARDFESREQKGLYSFISFINELIARRTEFDTKHDGAEGEAVNITTTHSSKGLEYPVVFLTECSAGFYPRNPKNVSNINYARGFGLSFPLRTVGGLGRVDGLVDFAIQDYKRERAFEEEMRVLYVALTRARERLYAFGKSKEPEEYIEKMREYGEIITPYSVKQLVCSLDVICASHPCAHYLAELAPEQTEDDEREAYTEVCEKPRPDAGISKEEFLKRFNFVYPDKHITELPQKMSVSRLSPTVLDGTEGTALELEKTTDALDDGEPKRTYPAFYTGKPADESAKRGIATHLFMQFCNLENVKANGAAAELERLLERGFISAADCERVRLREIEMFARSELFSAMLNAEKIHRELRFNVRLPAACFTEDEDKREQLSGKTVLVQGVIDCIIEDKTGNLRLVDYKTDRLSPAELADLELARQTLVEKHKTQLNYYALAIESIFGKRPERVEIYSLPLGKTVDCKVNSGK